MTDIPPGEPIMVPVMVGGEPPKGPGYRQRRTELALILLVVVTSVFSAITYFAQNGADRERAEANRSLIEAQQRTEECQTRFNEVFIDNLRTRTELAQRGAALTDELILAVGRGKPPLTPAAIARARARNTNLFADYAKKSRALKAERDKSPLLPYPDCARLTERNEEGIR